MIKVSEAMATPPRIFQTSLERKVYEVLQSLGIPFTRVDNDPAVTMADCEAIDAVLGVKVVKTLLLCNRKATSFYLYVMPGDRPFHASAFGAALQVSRVSFAPEEKLQELLGTMIGATTVFSCLLSTANDIRLVFDRSVLTSEWYGCTDGTTRCYIRLRTRDLIERFLPYTGHPYEIIDTERETNGF